MPPLEDELLDDELELLDELEELDELLEEELLDEPEEPPDDEDELLVVSVNPPAHAANTAHTKLVIKADPSLRFTAFMLVPYLYF